MGIKVNIMKVTEEEYMFLNDHSRLFSLLGFMRNQWIHDKDIRGKLADAYEIINTEYEKLNNEIEIDDKPD